MFEKSRFAAAGRAEQREMLLLFGIPSGQMFPRSTALWRPLWHCVESDRGRAMAHLRP